MKHIKLSLPNFLSSRLSSSSSPGIVESQTRIRSSSPSSPTRTVNISGIIFDPAEHPKYLLCVKLSIDGTISRLVVLNTKEEPTRDHSWSDPFYLQEGSILSIKVKEKRRFWDKTLTQLDLSLEQIWPEQEAYIREYPISRPGAKQKISLNVSMVPSSSSPTRSNDIDKTSQSHIPEKIAEDLEKAMNNLKEFKSLFSALGGPILERGKQIVDPFRAVHKTANIVIGFVGLVYEEVKTHDQHHKWLRELTESMQRILKFIPAAEGFAESDVLKGTVQSFYKLMDRTVDIVNKWIEQGGMSKAMKVFESQKMIEDLQKEYRALEKDFDRGVLTDSAAKLTNFQESKELKRLLGGITEVQPKVDSCMQGTRAGILLDVGSRTNKNIVWIRGAPGSGKSAISLTIKSQLYREHRLISYFRFDRNESAIATSSALWRRVAYDLADQYPSARESILALLRSREVDPTSTVDLFKLIEGALTKLPDPLPNQSLVVVIDALDECSAEGPLLSGRKALLETLGRWPELSERFKLIVTSRDEVDINQALSDISTPIVITSGSILNTNPQAQASIEVTEDIRTFLESRFQDIRGRVSSLSGDWPLVETITAMVNRAAGNFMWATTAANFIGCTGGDPQERLDKIMANVPESMEHLHSLYKTVLETSFGNITSDEAEVLRSVLGIMVLAKQPFQDIDYTELLAAKSVTVHRIGSIRNGLYSVVTPGPLRFTHSTVDDFLLSPKCPPKYAIDRNEAQRLLAKFCLTTMMKELRFNICDLETSCLKNVDVPDIETKVRGGISHHLSYSCCFWADHLCHTSVDEQLMGMVKDMACNKLLYWFEAMSLLKEIVRASHSLLLVLSWAYPSSDTELNDFIRDAHRFIRAYGHPISQSAPHIYISALPFAPEHSLVAQRFLPQFPRVLAVSVGRPTNWPPCVFISEHHNRSVRSVAFSPDEKYFISGSDDRTICICDSETGNLVSGPFRGSDRVTSSFFDPDGRRVWVCCWNGQVMSWDIKTGEEFVGFSVGGDHGDVIGCCVSNGGQNIISASQGRAAVTRWKADTGDQVHDIFKLPSGDNSRKVSFSPDGCYMAWAEFGDPTIRIWKLVDGSKTHIISNSQPHLRHEGVIYALSFSVDGHYAVSGFHDGFILICDAETGSGIGTPLATGMGCVHAVAHSHKNDLLVSACGVAGSVVVVWDALTQAPLLRLEGHTSEITGIALSSDGRRALSASKDNTVRMWELGREGVVPATHAVQCHVMTVWCVAFSPSGGKLASLGEDKKIRIWDSSTGEPLVGPIKTPMYYRKIIFSPDGSQIVAFDSDDGSIRAWSASNGDGVFENEDTWMAFLSTNQRLVTCSEDGFVRIWSLEDDFLTEDLPVSSPRPVCAGEPVRIISLSPDGLTAIVRDWHRTPRHYLWHTTTCTDVSFADGGHILGHPVAFSPSGKLFAAAQQDTLRVWNTQTGELAAAPLTLGGRLECLAFSPDDLLIAFSYCNGSNADPTAIWIWTHTGCLASGPWGTHTTSVTALTFSPDGGKLASGSSDGQIRIWDTTDLLEHPRTSVGAFGVETRIEDGWAVNENGKLLFWLPKDHRERLCWNHIAVVIGGSGIQTELDIAKFRYGKNWAECFLEAKSE